MITTKNIIEALNTATEVNELFIGEFVTIQFGELELTLKFNVTGHSNELFSGSYDLEAEHCEVFDVDFTEVILSNDSGDELGLGLNLDKLKEISKAFSGEIYEMIKTEYFENF